MAPSRTGPRVRGVQPADGLPPELGRFLGAASPQALTIRGPPGAGKSTLALAILEQFEGFRAYVTTRVPRAALLREHPWIESAGGPGIAILEQLRFRGGDPRSSLHIGQLRDALQARASDLVDLASVLSLPKELLDGMAAHPGAPRLVVIDSWEAWVENLLGPTPLAIDVPTTHWELERSLLDRFRDEGAHVILLVEREARDRIDYVADGALSLTFSESDGRVERWLAYQKLRGTRLDSATYPFTLEGGEFLCIRREPFHAPLGPIGVQPDPGPHEAGLWPGSTALAIRFGRLPAPGTTLLEADGETPIRLLGRLAVPIVASALRSGGQVAVCPPLHLTPRELEDALGAEARAPGEEGQLRIFGSDGDGGETRSRPAAGPASAPDETSAALRHARGQLASDGFFRDPVRPTARSLLAVFLESPPDSAQGAEQLRAFLDLASSARRPGMPLATVVVTTADSPVIAALRSRSALHLSVRASRGQFFLTGIRPWTPHFALTLPRPDEPGHPPFGLVPMV